MKNTFYNLFLMPLRIIYLRSCNKPDSEQDGRPYDPSKPTELLKSVLNSGKDLAKLILTDDNLDTPLKNLNVYFKNRKAIVNQTLSTDWRSSLMLLSM